VITQQGFGYVIAWMFLPTIVKFGLSIVCLFTLGLIGFFLRHLLYGILRFLLLDKEIEPVDIFAVQWFHSLAGRQYLHLFT